MAFQVSPGVAVAEIDLTTRVPIPSISDGAIAGNLSWGPLEEATLVTSEDELVSIFGKPNGNTYKTFFSAASFLSYSNKLRVVRAANTSSAKNSVSGGSAILIRNDREYQNTYESTTTSGTSFTSKYPGTLGNSLKISVCIADRGATKVNENDGTVSPESSTDVNLTGTCANSDTGAGITGSSTLFDTELRIGDVIVHGSNTGIVTAITSNTVCSISKADGGVETTGLGDGSAMTGATLVRKKRSAFEEPAGNMLGSLSVVAGSTTVAGADSNFTRQLHVGDIIACNDDTGVSVERRVSSLTNTTSMVVSTAFDRAVTSQATWSRKWEYRDSFAGPPLTSPYAYNKTSSKEVGDEIHVIVVDEDGDILGAKDSRGAKSISNKQVIGAWSKLSVANGATGDTGDPLYYKEVINMSSKYVRWTDHDAMGDAPLDAGSNKITHDWGDTLAQGNTTARFAGSFSAAGANGIMSASMSGGVDGHDSTVSEEIAAYSYFKDPAKIDVSLLISGEASNTLCTYLINEIAETRKDCVVFVSPEEADVVNKEGQEVTNAVARRNALPSTSYAVMDGSYKYMFDRYNSVNRWVPMNGDVAGICAQADNVNPYVSPAGFTRGNIKGAEFIAYVPNNAERDDLYINGINPIANFPGKGKVLFGDKTLLARPSSFDRINVRRLFIILEKAIANAAENLLFEFNDEFTRLNFISIIEPFLRDVQSSRGIEAFQVVCDGSNNTPAVINRNEFRGDIFIKPTKSINFIGLNFVAVASGVEFSEVVNAV
jgi:hypothetical protein